MSMTSWTLAGMVKDYFGRHGGESFDILRLPHASAVAIVIDGVIYGELTPLRLDYPDVLSELRQIFHLWRSWTGGPQLVWC